MGAQVDYVLLRRNALLKSAKTHDVDAYLISSPTNITYLTGFQHPTGCLIVSAAGTTLVADRETVARAGADCPGLGVLSHDGVAPIETTVADVLKKAGLRAAAVEARSLSVESLSLLRDAAGKITITPKSGLVEAQRAVKDASEIEEIRATTKIAERAFRMFAPQLRETDTERDMRDALDACIRRSGGWENALPTVVAVGDRGAAIDLTPGDTQLAEGSKLLLDFGVTLRYRSRLTRTCKAPFMVTPSRKTKRERLEYDIDTVFAAVLGARDAAIDVLCEGTPIKDADAAVRSALNDAGLGEFALDVTGHGIGLETIEGPIIRAGAEGDFQSGMVICLGPGVVIPGWGALRVADPVLVTRDRAVLLSSRPVTLNELL